MTFKKKTQPDDTTSEDMDKAIWWKAGVTKDSTPEEAKRWWDEYNRLHAEIVAKRNMVSGKPNELWTIK